MRIEPYTHTCIYEDGDLAGNTHHVEVTAWDVRDERECEVCGNRLATVDDILLHVYEELTE